MSFDVNNTNINVNINTVGSGTECARQSVAEAVCEAVRPISRGQQDTNSPGELMLRGYLDMWGGATKAYVGAVGAYFELCAKFLGR